VRRKQGNCDVLGPSPEQLRKIAAQHLASERDLEQAEAEAEAANARVRRVRQQAEAEAEAANARVRRLRKQKKLWFEKMMRAVSRGIDSVEELERVEKEEAEREAAKQQEAVAAGVPAGRSSTEDLLDSDFLSTWDGVYSEVSLDPSLMVDLGFLNEPSEGSSAAAGGTS
jgi:pyruvate/2-oxoglutarate dehydrogenase complex dihydrolipoamide acyltransferase (E2) component